MQDKMNCSSNVPPDSNAMVVVTTDPDQMVVVGTEECPTTSSLAVDNTGSITLRYMCPHVDQLRSNQVRSEAVKTRSMLWRIMVTTKMSRKSFLKENDTNCNDSTSSSDDSIRHLSVYVQCDPVKDSKFWHCYAKCRITLVSRNPAKTISREFRNNFSKKDNDFGYSEFISFNSLMDGSNEYLESTEENEDGTCGGNHITILANVVTEYPYGVDWDSRGNTNHVGLLNLGATCYMNSLLQTFYFTNQLRLATYNTPTYLDDNDNSIMYALQYIFYQLQFSQAAVDTTRLTQAFGWTQADSFQQHDVQEFCRILLESMENSMKGTAAENIIAKLLEGKQMSYIKCVHVDYNSEKVESVYDIQLKVKGLRNVYDSFEDYIQIEKLEGENKYAAEGYGYQEANKGVIFTHFPPVLHLHLMRFTFDVETLDFIKIKDRYEFPEELNLDRFLHKDHVNPDDPAIYTLAGVMVHIGGINSGHYVVYINPDCSGQWLKFDDDLVVRVNKNEAVEDNFGGSGASVFKPGTTAYMLVYVRNSAKDHVFKGINYEDIPSDLISRITHDLARERFQQYKYEHQKDVVNLQVYLEDCFYVNQSIGLIECGNDRGYFFEFFQNYTFGQALCYVCTQLKIHPSACKVWMFGEENINNTPGLPKMFPEELYSTYIKDLVCYTKKLTIFLDVTVMPYDDVSVNQQLTPVSSRDCLITDGQTVPAPSLESAPADSALIFIKYFNVATPQLNYIGHVYVDPNLTWNYYMDFFLEKCGILRESSDNGDSVGGDTGDNGMWNIKTNHSITLFIDDINDAPIKITDRDSRINDFVVKDQACILCVQENNVNTAAASILGGGGLVDLPQFVYEKNHNFQVKFIDKKLPKAIDRCFVASLPPNATYVDFMSVIRSHVMHPEEQIQLYYSTSKTPDMSKLQILIKNNPFTVFDIAKKSKSFLISPDNRSERACTIYYDCLDICVDELVDNVRFHLRFMPDMHTPQIIADRATQNDDLDCVNKLPPTFTSCFHLPLMVPKLSTVKTLIECANRYLQSIDYPLNNTVRILEVVSSKVVCILSNDIAVSRIIPPIEKTLLVEECPPNQLPLSFPPNSNDRLVNCCFCRNKNFKQYFGIPFLVRISQGMSFNSIFVQIKSRLECYPNDFLNQCSLFVIRPQLIEPFPPINDTLNMLNEFPFERIFPRNIDQDMDVHGDDEVSRFFTAGAVICINMNTPDTSPSYVAATRNHTALRIGK